MQRTFRIECCRFFEMDFNVPLNINQNCKENKKNPICNFKNKRKLMKN